MTDDVDPEYTANESYPTNIFDGFMERMREGLRFQSLLMGIDPDNPEHIYEEVPKTEEELVARLIFAIRFRRMLAEGEKKEYLEREHCYECGGELKISEKMTNTVKLPNPDYDPNKPVPEPYPGFKEGKMPRIIYGNKKFHTIETPHMISTEVIENDDGIIVKFESNDTSGEAGEGDRVRD